jgi:hypothetical protein
LVEKRKALLDCKAFLYGRNASIVSHSSTLGDNAFSAVTILNFFPEVAGNGQHNHFSHHTSDSGWNAQHSKLQ